MKAQSMDPIFIGVALLATGITIVIYYIVASAINSAVVAGGYDTYGMMAYALNAIQTYDTFFAMFFVALWITSIASASQINTHPIFFVVSFVFTLISVLVNALLGNVFYDLVAGSTFISGAMTVFPMMSYVMQHLPLLALLGSVVIAVMMINPNGRVVEQ